MQPVQHQMMGYDRTSAMFSPDGRLLQVEYAKKTVKQGSAAVGVVCKDGVVLVGDKRFTDKLTVPKSMEKVMQVDDHVGATYSGLTMDGRVLIEKAQLIAQQHRLTYDEQIDMLTLVKEISDIKQAFTQYGGARPFGVSMLFGGVNSHGPELFLTDPTGIFFEYKATAIGEGENEVKAILEKQYKENMTIEDGFALALSALKRVLGKEFNIERFDGAYVKTSKKKFTKLDKNTMAKYA
jgi:proteasome alpha subunit